MNKVVDIREFLGAEPRLSCRHELVPSLSIEIEHPIMNQGKFRGKVHRTTVDVMVFDKMFSTMDECVDAIDEHINSTPKCRDIIEDASIKEEYNYGTY